ncbi:MAG: hypothetical protein PVG93_04795 [Phycisphaerales bacterium]|jgi:hypothetical protein
MKKCGFQIGFLFAVVCMMLPLFGCEQPAGETVIQQPGPVVESQEAPRKTVSLRPKQDFQQGQVTYKVITDAQRTLRYEGALADDNRFKDGRNVNRVEMTFTQDNQNVNDRGNIVAKITIDDLKVNVVMRNETTFDFDSSREKDMARPLAGLIGLDYTVELSPNGQFVSVVDANKARSAVSGRSDEHKRAQFLLRDSVIEQRHSFPDISADEVFTAAVGNSWSSIKSFEFPILGKKSYERVYTLKQVEQLDGRSVAVIDMKALPSAGNAEETVSGPLMDMFDNRRAYTGQLKLDLDARMVESYFEELNSEWQFVDPEADTNSDKAPASFRMGAVRSYSIERIN